MLFGGTLAWLVKLATYGEKHMRRCGGNVF